MALRFSLVDDVTGLHALEERWSALAAAGGPGALFRSPRWLLAWWHSYHRQLGAELYTFVGFAGDELVAIAPFYRRTAKLSPGVKAREIRLLGDAGPRPPALGLLVEPGHEEAVGNALAAELEATSADWDVLDLQPLQEPSRARAYMANALATAGRAIDSSEAGGARRVELAVAGIDPTSDAVDERHSAYVAEAVSLRKGLAALRRLSRLEWADREEPSPIADREATHLLEDVTLPLGLEGRARLARLDDADHEARAVALVVDDEQRAVVLAMAVDPEHPSAAPRLLAAEARAAAERGCVSLDVAAGADEYELPHLPWRRVRSLRLRAYGSSPAATVARGYGAVVRSVEAATHAPGAAAAGARAAWTKIRTAAAHVAGYERLHLYRGELWTRGIAHTPGLSMSVFTEEDFDAQSEAERSETVESVELAVDHAREKWRRGDLVILARINERPAGIAWCARGPVPVPELDRTLHLGPGEAYIHDVFVAPHARGRAVAPSMLEFLAHELRQRDVYRSWALIGTDNVASVRAFEKAAYAAVCDVIYARMAAVDKLMVRPPDPEAKMLLGL